PPFGWVNGVVRDIIKQIMPGMLGDAITEVSQFMVQWMTTATSDQISACFFINSADGFAMDCTQPPIVATGQLEQNSWNNSTNQQFLVEALAGDDTGYFSITAQGNGKVLDLLPIANSTQTAVVSTPWGGDNAPDTQKWN